MGEIKLLTIQETAEILRVHRATVSRMISAGELPFVEIRSRKLVRLQDLHGFIDNHIAKAGERSRED
ncbi:helix-turn-helix domain-containing protein [Salidesulfovibrio brasiliensis]|uniref:helix-turn-helix domain-containing protein n=1 Tax=Salidesulfovibrio brasiliensis TaxID=221711 RepID=UPI0006D1E445|nr:helix-turn-helix domain-containing protein [Salidesulfovibrio brasiliensis]